MFSSSSSSAENSVDAVCIASRLFDRGSLLMLGSNFELTSFVDGIFDVIYSSNRSDRVAHINLLALLLRSHDTTRLEGRLCTFIEKLQGVLESAKTFNEKSAIVEVVDALFSMPSNSGVVARFGKILSKLIAYLGRKSALADWHDTALSLMEILTIHLGSLILPSSSVFRQSCWKLLTHPIHYSKSCRVVALVHSSESNEVWSQYWLTYSNELAKCVSKMGIFIGGLNTDIILAEADILPPITKHISGQVKALAHERQFRGCCGVLAEMLSVGSCTAPLALDMSVLVPVLTTVLSLHIDAPEHDPKTVIENEYGLSPADLCAVSSQLKVHALIITQSLLSTNHPSLLRIAAAIYRPVASLLGSREAECVPALAAAAVECVALAAKCFPTVVARSAAAVASSSLSSSSSSSSGRAVGPPVRGSGGPVALVEMLQAEVHLLTSCKTSLSAEMAQAAVALSTGGASGGSKQREGLVTLPLSLPGCKGGYGSATAAGPAVVMEAVETLLLYCGALLPNTLREAIQAAIAEGLLCMSKGCLPAATNDKKLKRAPSESLRHQPTLQALLLRLAATEVMTPAAGGILSGNVTILQRASEAALRQRETSNEAARCLLIVETILQPSMVSIPGVPAIMTARSLLGLSHGTSAYAGDGSAGAGAGDRHGPTSADTEEKWTKEIGQGGGKRPVDSTENVDSESANFADKRRREVAHRQNEVVESPELSSLHQVKSTKPTAPSRAHTALPLETAAASGTFTFSKSAAVGMDLSAGKSSNGTARDMGDDGDDDDDIPDIDIVADPDYRG